LALNDVTVTARTIAHNTKVARQVLADVAGLATVIDSRLIYGVNRRVESQLLNGRHTGENLLGILQTTALYDAAAEGRDLSPQERSAVMSASWWCTILDDCIAAARQTLPPHISFAIRFRLRGHERALAAQT
jgi:HK97 family phage major capsid protein